LEAKIVKRAAGLFPSIVDFAQLRKSAWFARRGIKMNEEMASFFYQLESNIVTLQQELKEDCYHPRPFRSFVIQDPKRRLIQAAHFRDRVVHHSLCAVIAPHLERSYIQNSFACQKGKGSHRAVQQAFKYTKLFECYAKIDILHFFENLDHEVLFELLHRRIKDRDCLNLLNRIISHGGQAGRGVPIGNLTSQHFANFYLDWLDHFIIEKLGVGGIIRYMDDILLFGNNLIDLQQKVQKISYVVEEILCLQLKPSATRIEPTYAGVPFLGFRLGKESIRFDGGRKRRFIQKWKNLECQYQQKELTQEQYAQRSNSMFSWAEQGDTLHLRRGLLQQGWLGES
jgi:RNA-directed DNA polymerase